MDQVIVTPEVKYAQLGPNDTLVFAIAKTECLLNAIKGHSYPLGVDDEPWLRVTCDEIIALVLKAASQRDWE